METINISGPIPEVKKYQLVINSAQLIQIEQGLTLLAEEVIAKAQEHAGCIDNIREQISSQWIKDVPGMIRD